MLGAIAESASAFVGRRRAARNPQVYFEFWAAEGTPDLVFFEFDAAELAHREEVGLGPVTGYSDVMVLAALRARPLGISELASQVMMSPAHLRRTVLPGLAQRSWVVQAVDRRWMSPIPIRPLASWIAAIEAKRRDWKRALAQADRYRRFANRVVVVLDAAAAVQPALVQATSDGRVGVATLSAATGRIRPLLLPAWKPARISAEFILAGEQAYSMRRAGVHSGVVLPVFGRTLTAQDRPDPRLTAPVPAERRAAI